MHPLQPRRRSNPHSQQELLETVKPFQQRSKLDEEDRFDAARTGSFSSASFSQDSQFEGRFIPAFSPAGSMPRHIPAYVEPNQNYSDGTSNEPHRSNFNEMTYDCDVYAHESEQAMPSGSSFRNPSNYESFSNNPAASMHRPIDSQNFFQQPHFMNGFNHHPNDHIQHHPSSLIHQYGSQPYQSTDVYGYDTTYYPEYLDDFRTLSIMNRIPGGPDFQPSQTRFEESSIDRILRPKGSAKQASISLIQSKLLNKKVKKDFLTPYGPDDVCTLIESDDKNNDKTPVPQNLRGDPFRSAKVKTELCRHFGTAKGCPFGDKCNYAHGEHELKYTKLMDLERAGLIDIEIYRTHPCPAWVATGACPFDSRCSGLHDPRIRGTSSSWLPHAETMMNRIGDSTLNIDKLYHQRLSEVYSCSPIYGYVPLKRWSFQRLQSALAWAHFYSFICNIDQPIHSRIPQAKNDENVFEGIEESLEPISKSFDDSDIYRLMIVLEMRKSRQGQSFVYMPTHIVCGELCMLIQSRRFKVFQSQDSDSSYSWHIIELSTKEKSEISTGGQQQSTKIVNAYEIAFGPVGDPSARPLSIWFDIPCCNLTPCTQKEAKNHKRSRHRLKKNRKKEKIQPVGKNQITNDKLLVLENTDSLCLDSLPLVSFNHYQPLDQAAFDHTTAILEHRLSVLELRSSKIDISMKKEALQNIVNRHKHLKRIFESLRRHWIFWSWPINFMEDEIHDETDVIPVDSEYQFALDDRDNFRTTAFHGVTQGTAINEVFRHRSKLALSMIWSSFLTNISSTPSETVLKGVRELKGTFKFSRLHIFENLSCGKKISKKRNIITLNQSNQNDQGIGITILQICEQWKSVEQHIYEKNQGLRASSHANDSQERRGAITPSMVSESSTDDNDMSNYDDPPYLTST